MILCLIFIVYQCHTSRENFIDLLGSQSVTWLSLVQGHCALPPSSPTTSLLCGSVPAASHTKNGLTIESWLTQSEKNIILTDVNNHQHHTIDSFTNLTERPNFTDRSKPADQSYIACISRVQAFSISAKVT